MIIPLTNSPAFAIVSDIDADRVLQHCWFLKKCNRKHYPAMSKRVGKKVKTILLHRFIMQPEPEQDVHHVDNNTLNATRENLENQVHGLHSVLTNDPMHYRYMKHCDNMGYG